MEAWEGWQLSCSGDTGSGSGQGTVTAVGVGVWLWGQLSPKDAAHGQFPCAPALAMPGTGGLKEGTRALSSPGHWRDTEATSWSKLLLQAPSLPGDRALLGQQ